MKETPEHNERIAKLTFAAVYPSYVKKVERKGRTKEELDEIIGWLTGYNPSDIERLVLENVSFQAFFQNARLHPNASLIKGVICGYRIEELENPLTRQVRCLDKLVDELAKGRGMDKIKR